MSDVSTPTLLNASQRSVLAAIVNTIVGACDPACCTEIVARRVKEAHLSETGVTAADLESYMEVRGSDLGVVEAVESTMQRHLPSDVSWQLGLILSAMSSSVGNLALSGHMTPFQDLSAEDREKVGE